MGIFLTSSRMQRPPSLHGADRFISVTDAANRFFSCWPNVAVSLVDGSSMHSLAGSSDEIIPFLACRLLKREQSLDIGEVIDEVRSVRLRQKQIR
jgi:hypothetical protein